MASIGGNIILIAIGMFLMFYLSFKGVGLIPIGLIVGVVFCLGSTDGFITQFFTNFTGSFASYATTMCLPMLFGAIFSAMMSVSGCGEAMAKGFIKRFPGRLAPYAALLLACLLLMCGMSFNWVFIVGPVAFALFEAADLPLLVAAVAGYGGAAAVAAMPGLANEMAILTSQTWGISMYSAGGTGLAMVLLSVVLLAILIEYMMKHFKKKGIGYTAPPVSFKQEKRAEDKIPPFGLGVLPLILVIALILVFHKFVGLAANASVIFAEVITMVVMLIFCRPYMTEKLSTTVTQGALRGAPVLVGACTIYAMGSCINQMPLYSTLIAGLSSINANPYVLTAVVIFVCCALTGGMSAGVGVFMGSFSSWVVASGAHMGYVTRIMAQASTVFDTMPHSVLMNMICEYFGVKLKDAYPWFILSNILIPLIVTIFGIVMAMIFG